MPIEKWSDTIAVVHTADDPQFSDDLDALDKAVASPTHVVLDFGAVHYINSSNIAKLLRLRRKMLDHHVRLVLCNITSRVWSAFQVTGLDKLFEVSENVPTALATLQMDAKP